MSAPADADAAPTDPAEGGSPPRLRLLRPRARRVDLAIAALLLVLGFAAVVQVRSTQGDGVLASARQEDLVRILDDLDGRDERLRREIEALAATRERLTGGTGRDEAALAEARRRTQVLAVLAGTAPAEGPGITVVITDPDGELGAEVLLDALQELRDAGAEAVQLEGPVTTEPGTGGAESARVRVVASTSFADAEGGVSVDGVLLRAPYRFVVVGEPAVLAPALGIPGGVVDAVERVGGRAVVTRREQVLVSALRPLAQPQYARPAPAEGE